MGVPVGAACYVAAMTAKKRVGILISGRGSNMEALIEALRDGEIAGAAIDIFDVEPLPADHPYRRTDGLLITPHMGYVTQETMANFYPDLVEAIRAFLDGREPELRLV